MILIMNVLLLMQHSLAQSELQMELPLKDVWPEEHAVHILLKNNAKLTQVMVFVFGIQMLICQLLLAKISLVPVLQHPLQLIMIAMLTTIPQQ